MNEYFKCAASGCYVGSPMLTLFLIMESFGKDIFNNNKDLFSMYKVIDEQTDVKLPFEYEFKFNNHRYLLSGEADGFITDWYDNTPSSNPNDRWVRQDYDVNDFKIKWIEFYMDGEEIERAEFWERLKESKQTEKTTLDSFIKLVIIRAIENLGEYR